MKVIKFFGLELKVKLILLPILIILISIIYFFMNQSNSASTIPIQKKNIKEAVYGLGTVHSSQIYHLKLGVISSIKKLYVHEGDSVKKGAKLVDFESFPTFYSPIDGVVTVISFEENETVFSGANVLTVMNLEDKHVLVSLDETAVMKARKSTDVMVSFDVLKEKVFNCKIQSIYPSEFQFQVHINCLNLPIEIFPGMSADAVIVTKTKENAWVVPKKYISNGAKKISIVRNGKEMEISTGIGLEEAELVELISNEILDGDLLVISSGQNK